MGYEQKINLAVCLHQRCIGTYWHQKECCRDALVNDSVEL